MKIVNMIKSFIFLLFCSTLVLTMGCKKELAIGQDPYAGGKEPFGVKFMGKYTDPESGKPGSLMNFSVKGVKAFEKDIQFFINEQATEVVSLNDSVITVKIPELVSSGAATIKIDNQVFFGPYVTIEGKVGIDKNYDIVSGFNNSVNAIYPYAGGLIVGGFFNNFDLEASETVFRNGMHYITANGKTATNFNFQKGTVDGVKAIVRQNNGQLIIGGYFQNYNEKSVNGLARLNANGTLDTTIVSVLNTTPEKPENGYDTVSTFNGGVIGGDISRTFLTKDEKILVVGSFSHYVKVDYNYSSRNSKRGIFTKARSVIRLKNNGDLDSTYMHDHTGANGIVLDAILQEDDKLVLVGLFTQFNGKAAKGIVRLNVDGTIDPTFNVGSAADDRIFSMTYNQQLQKFAITGIFKNFNGRPANGVVLLDKSGSVDTQFKFGDVGDGSAQFAQLLNSGKVLVAGNLKKYNGINRSALLILNEKGEAEQQYNNMGPFMGSVAQVIETTSSLGNPAIYIAGNIFKVDNKAGGGLFKLEIKN
ncbi:DUF5008 domain-containing protein [Sphingobacteriaceae bacterium WQ 2009]|uniref:DUF5008 domain-containing protein n=1 Tax=Rhinopithecimicrobium faecis TaxID=2820698 RepID=A0A8T4HCC9_9SPHI|nr:DUF5008 domain-containing protein [Sphingobacteriaceae bacterium WQ 2009]